MEREIATLSHHAAQTKFVKLVEFQAGAAERAHIEMMVAIPIGKQPRKSDCDGWKSMIQKS